MTGGHPHLVRVRGDAPDAAATLVAALDDADAVLVLGGDLELADGAVERMLRLLHRPHRRLLRVHTAGGTCYLARAELLSSALRHGVPAAMLAGDPPGLDREIATAVDAVDLAGPTPLEDPASGRWRLWLDGAEVGVRPATEEDPAWARTMARRHGPVAGMTTFLRRRAGRVRRETRRLRDRPQR
ncbi:MAG TPA: hypothetical protein H9805_02755 [Candidatus Janibacter merdipullorum]|nr:hypothetical protein [Candidatus Janibacter merdipullorum]